MAMAKKGLGLMDMGDESDTEEATPMAAEDLISAVKSGDASAVKAAFKRMYDECSAHGEEEFDGEV